MAHIREVQCAVAGFVGVLSRGRSMRNKGVYRYDLNLRRGGRLKIVRIAQRLENGFILEREETLVWDRGEMVPVSLRDGVSSGKHGN